MNSYDYECSTAAEITMLQSWARAGKFRALRGYISGARWRHDWGAIHADAVLRQARELAAQISLQSSFADPTRTPYFFRRREREHVDNNAEIG